MNLCLGVTSPLPSMTSVRELPVVVNSMEVNEMHAPYIHIYLSLQRSQMGIILWFDLFSRSSKILIGLAFDPSQRIRVCQGASKKKKKKRTESTK